MTRWTGLSAACISVKSLALPLLRNEWPAGLAVPGGFGSRRDAPPLLLIPRQHRIDPGDERREMLHVFPQELLGRFVGDAPIGGDQALFKLDVGLDGIHQRRVAEGENAPQVLLGDGRADLAGGRTDDA